MQILDKKNATLNWNGASLFYIQVKNINYIQWIILYNMVIINHHSIIYYKKFHKSFQFLY